MVFWPLVLLGPGSRGRSATRRQAYRREPPDAKGRRPGRAPGGFQLGLLLALLALPSFVLTIGFLVEGLQPPLQRSDAIVVISGDEDLARFRAGLTLWQEAWAPLLIFSGAALEGPISNAEAMRRLALGAGVPPEAILLEEQGTNTYGNALHTRSLMESNGLRSAILVTSPYHLQRAALTFGGVYQGSGIQLIASAAPDSDWRKRSWWLRSDLRLLTLSELEKLSYILLTGRYT
jgi:uncharacterized SAM-binding protein YcdF (DUF218 family)